MLELKNITFNAEGESKSGILNDLSLKFDDGKYTVITGPNGGGKTTLARIIMGIYSPASGQVLLDGKDITEDDITTRAKAGISYAFQQPPRFKGITVHELLNTAAGRKLKRDECCKILTKVGLCAGNYIDREADASLSGGEMKRIEIATLFARKPRIMIFDEPEAGIDLWSFSKLTEALNELHDEKNTTLIVISHQERIIAHADEVILLAGGKLMKRGTPAEILDAVPGFAGNECKYMASAQA